MVIIKLPHISAGSTTTQMASDEQTTHNTTAHQSDTAKLSSPGRTPRFKRKREASTSFRKRRLPRINISRKRESPTGNASSVICLSEEKLKLTTTSREHASCELAQGALGQVTMPLTLNTHTAPSTPPRKIAPRARLASEDSHYPAIGTGSSNALTRDRSRGILEALPSFSTGKASKVGSLGRDMTAESSDIACSSLSFDLPSARPRGTVTLRREARAQDLPKWRHLIALANEENGDGDLYLLSNKPQSFEPPQKFYERRQQQRREKYWLGDCEDDSFEGPVYPDPRHDRPFWIPQTPASKGLPVPLRRNGHKRPASIYFEEVTEQDLPIEATPPLSRPSVGLMDRAKMAQLPRGTALMYSPTSSAVHRNGHRSEYGVEHSGSPSGNSLKLARDSSISPRNDCGSFTPDSTHSEGRLLAMETPTGRTPQRTTSVSQWTKQLQQEAAIKVSPWLQHSTPHGANGVSDCSGTRSSVALHDDLDHSSEGSGSAHCEMSDEDCHSEALKTTPSLSSLGDSQGSDPLPSGGDHGDLSFACRGLQAEDTVNLSPCSWDPKGTKRRSVEDSLCLDDPFLVQLAERSEAWSQRMNWRPRPLMLRPEKQSPSSDQLRLFLGRHRLSTASYRPPALGTLPTSSSLPIFGAVTPAPCRKGILNRSGLPSCVHSRDMSTDSCVSHNSVPQLQRSGRRELVLPSMVRQRQDL